MFGRTKIYSVYVKQGVVSPLESAVFVKQGFSFGAFIFTVLWALYHRLWLVSIIVAVVSAFFAVNDGVAFAISSLLFSVWFGLEANNFLALKMEKRGYVLFDISTGIDKLAAEARFYDKYLLNKQQNTKQGSFSSMKPATS